MRWTVAVLVIASVAVHAQPYQAVIMGGQQTCLDGETATHRRTLEWIEPDRIESDTTVFRIDANLSRRVHALTFGPPYQILTMTPDGVRTPFANGSGYGWDLAVAETGRVYVMAFRDDAFRIDRFSPSGVLEASYPRPASPEARGPGFDVAADGCTLFYATGNSRDRIDSTIHRFDGCTGTPLADFGSVPYVDDLEVQPNGTVLISGHGAVLLYNHQDVLFRTLASDPGDFGFDPLHYVIDQVSVRDGVLWLTMNNPCAEGNLLRLSFNDGHELSRQRVAAVNVAYDLVAGSASTTSIPLASPAVLALFAAALAAAGLLMAAAHQQ